MLKNNGSMPMLKYVILVSALLSTMPAMANTANIKSASNSAKYYNDFLVYQVSESFDNITENQKFCFLNRGDFRSFPYTVEKILKNNLTEDENRVLEQLYTNSYSLFDQEFMRMELTPEQALERLKNRQVDYVFRLYYYALADIYTDSKIEGSYQEAIVDLQNAIDSGALKKANELFANTDVFDETQKARFNEMIAEAKQKCHIE